MADEKCPRCVKVADVWTRADELKKLMDVYDAQIESALSVGMDQGRILGLLEAATALEKAGYGNLGDVIKKLVDDDLITLSRSGGEA